MRKLLAFLFACSLLSAGCSSEDPVRDIIEVVDDEADDLPEEDVILTAPCVDGFAGVFPCQGYGLMSRVPLGVLGGNTGNDVWGWTDPESGKEYALMGLNTATVFVDVTDAANPIYLGRMRTHTVNSSWRDIKVYDHYAFVVSEAMDHGMQVFDLTRLRSVSAGSPQVFEADAHYDAFGNAHNMVINTETAYAYAVGSDTFNGGPHFIDISNPLNPLPAGGYEMADYSHDAQVVTYSGPDADHFGEEILIGSNENEVVIVDISDKNKPVEISRISYPQVGYTHQGWFTENQQYFLLGDELDELDFGFNSRTIVLDLTDLDEPLIHTSYFGPTTAVDHNGYVKGNRYYLANYRAGLRVIDISGIQGGELTEIGYFDSFPEDDMPGLRGAWSVYPYFASGNILISNIDEGLLVVRKQ